MIVQIANAAKGTLFMTGTKANTVKTAPLTVRIYIRETNTF